MTYPTELCARAASYLLVFVSMYDHAGNDPNPNAGRKGSVFEDTHSDRSFSTHLLLRLRLIEFREPANFICLVDKEETLPFFLKRDLSDGEREQVVGEYLMTLCEWEKIPTSRSDFVLPAAVDHVRATLIEYGLCEERGRALRWSDHAGPAMRSGRQWDALNRSIAEAKDQAVKEEAERIWALMPGNMKDMLIRETDEHYFLVIWKLLKDHWDGSQWAPRTDVWPPIEYELAQAFLELVRRRQSAGGLIAVPLP